MKPLAIRQARRFDAGAMARLLDAVPGRADLPVDASVLRDWIDGDDLWHLAERGGDLRGFQWLGTRRDLPPDTCEIATFIAADEDGIAAGSALFDATIRAARARSIAWIVATHDRSNTGARTYYRSRGFEEAGGTRAAALLPDRQDMNRMVTMFRL